MLYSNILPSTGGCITMATVLPWQQFTIHQNNKIFRYCQIPYTCRWERSVLLIKPLGVLCCKEASEYVLALVLRQAAWLN